MFRTVRSARRGIVGAWGVVLLVAALTASPALAGPCCPGDSRSSSHSGCSGGAAETALGTRHSCSCAPPAMVDPRDRTYGAEAALIPTHAATGMSEAPVTGRCDTSCRSLLAVPPGKPLRI